MKPTTTSHILDLLRSNGWVSYKDLAAVTPRYGARLQEIRRTHTVEMKNDSEGPAYRLMEDRSMYPTKRCSCGWQGISWQFVPERTCPYGHKIG